MILASTQGSVSIKEGAAEHKFETKWENETKSEKAFFGLTGYVTKYEYWKATGCYLGEGLPHNNGAYQQPVWIYVVSLEMLFDGIVFSFTHW